MIGCLMPVPAQPALFNPHPISVRIRDLSIEKGYSYETKKAEEENKFSSTTI